MEQGALLKTVLFYYCLFLALKNGKVFLYVPGIAYSEHVWFYRNV